MILAAVPVLGGETTLKVGTELSLLLSYTAVLNVARACETVLNR